MTIAKKIAQLLVTIVLVTLFASFLLVLLPGDPSRCSSRSGARSSGRPFGRTPASTDPFLVRYGEWLGGFVQGDLGNYYTVSSIRPVADQVGDALPISLTLVLEAQILALIIAIPLGVLTAYRSETWFDRMSNTTAFAMLAIPTFALGFILQYYLQRGARVVLVGGVDPDHRVAERSHRQGGPARDHAGGRPDRHLHATAPLGHDRHAPVGLHHDGEGEGPADPTDPVPPRPADRRR